jgi:hypothetical protein
MPFPQAQLPRYPVQVLTTTYHIQGGLETIGPILDFVNDRERDAFVFLDATVKSLTPGPMGQVTRPHISVPKPEVIAMYFDDATARSSIQMLRRVERSIMYMPYLVCRGEFHLGTDTRWQDMVSLLPTDFFAFTNASVFPLSPLPGPFPQQAELVVLNRRHIKMLHLDQA